MNAALFKRITVYRGLNRSKTHRNTIWNNGRRPLRRCIRTKANEDSRMTTNKVSMAQSSCNVMPAVDFQSLALCYSNPRLQRHFYLACSLYTKNVAYLKHSHSLKLRRKVLHINFVGNDSMEFSKNTKYLWYRVLNPSCLLKGS